MLFVFFFCKQKTAYEMRISDWSSDVCSSDLGECSEYPGHHSSSTIFPICSPVSMRAWAAAASARGKRLSITGRNFPSLTNGQTDFSSSSAIIDLKPTERGRRVDPVKVNRLRITSMIGTSDFAPRWVDRKS